jgi:hypothetical protein
MRLSRSPPTLISLLLVPLSHPDAVRAVPYPKEPQEDSGLGYLEDRSEVMYCGASNQYTCTGAEACFTNAANVAYCSVPSAGYAVYTTTYTETDLVLGTSTYTSSWYVAPATTTESWAPSSSAAICDTSEQQTSCGPICCTSEQYCASSGSCVAIPPSGLTSWTYVPTSYSAPLRPTSAGLSTWTSVLSATTTEPFIPPATASGGTLPLTIASTSGLKGGAIAGIVIGTVAGVLFLLLICFCCMVQAGFDGLLAVFGLGSRRHRRSTETVEIIEEQRYSRQGGSGTASRRDRYGARVGAGGGRPARVAESRKKQSGGLGLGAVGAGLVTLAVLLGLKRRHDRKEMMERSEVSASYFSEESYTATSESKQHRSLFPFFLV